MARSAFYEKSCRRCPPDEPGPVFAKRRSWWRWSAWGPRVSVDTGQDARRNAYRAEHAIRRARHGAIRRLSEGCARALREARSTRAFDARIASSWLFRHGFFDGVEKVVPGGQGTEGRVQPPGRRARRAVSPARAYDSESAPRPGRAATATLERARDSRKTETRRADKEHHGGRGKRGADDARSRERGAPKRAREERDIKVMPRRARRSE